MPPYQTDTVRNVTREVRQLDRETANILAPFSGKFNPSEDPATACALLVNHLAMRRNKRCLLAYHRVRTEKAEGMCWNGVDVLEGQARAQNANNGLEGGHSDEAGTEISLSPEEEEYVRRYGELLAAYKGQWTDIDLTGSLDPPKDLFIEVRSTVDAGEIQTEYGSINLSKNSQFYVRQNDVERLIAQGYLQKIG